MEAPREVTEIHTRLQNCTLEVENSRAYWRRASVDGEPVQARQAFEEYWFGARSLPRVQQLLANFRFRFDTYPFALRVLTQWPDMEPEIRRLICHWHLQLTDPLYRQFSGEYLIRRRESLRGDVTHDLAVRWVEDQAPGRWSMSTRIQFGSRLLSVAHAAGLVGSNHDPRSLEFPRVPPAALAYLLYLLRGVEFEGTLLDNPYVTSVGLEGQYLEERLRSLPGLRFQRQGDLVDFGWTYPDLTAWAGDLLVAGEAR